jgi:malate dehydrogenase (oxaloacetate-decarboxylating)
LPLPEQRIVIMGAGNAGMGVTDQIHGAIRRYTGLSDVEARAHFWLLDKAGLLVESMPMTPSQLPYARSLAEISAWSLPNPEHIGLLDVVTHVKPTILIGCSAVTGAFNEEVIKTMATYTEHPIIMPLSNPSSLAEAQPADLLKWTGGKAIIATGSPYPNIVHEGKRYRIPLSNNAFAFPGIGLGIIAVKAKRLTDDILWAATQALSQCSPVHQDKTAPLLPSISETKMISFKIALAVAETARQQGLAQVSKDANLADLIRQTIWEPRYYPYHKGS